MSTKYNVGLIGFNKRDSDKMVKIFHLTKSKDRQYQLTWIDDNTKTDLLLVNIDSDYQQVKNDYLKAHPQAIVITVSKKQEAPSESSWHIKGLLLATRVIKVLDSIPLTQKNPSTLLTTDANKVNKVLTIENNNKTPETSPLIDKVTVSSTPVDNYDFHVLIVDDSPAMQTKLANELAHATQSIGIEFADSGEIALTKLKQNHYDFIFLDVMMPGIDGYETCTQLRTLKHMKKTPVIMLSAKTSPLDEVKGVMAGCTCYLTKPINSAEFQKMLSRIMGWLQDFKAPQIIMES